MSNLDEAIRIANDISFPKAKEAPVAEAVKVSPIVEEPVVSVSDTVADKKDDFTSNFEKITKQEKHNAEIRRQLEEKRKEFEADKADLERYRQFDKKLKESPLEVLEKLGLSVEMIQKLAEDKKNPINSEARQALERVQKLEKELEVREQKLQQERLNKEEIRLNASIAETVKANGYDVIEHFGKEAAVRAYMESHYDSTGEIIDIDEACKAVTKEIVSKISKVKQSKWLQETEVKKEPEEVNSTVKTLSNKMIQSSTKEAKPRNEAERLEAAIRILNGG
jgi:predicted phage gp36 major capsid-like protein